MVYDQPLYFYLLVALPIMVGLYIVYAIWKNKKQDRFARPENLKFLAPNRSSFKSPFKFILQLLGIACLILALVNPKIGTKLETVKREGVDIVFALDVSKSMLAEDIAPNRLEKAKRLVSEIINDLASDRVGIIAYAGQAYPQLPITTDYGAAKMFLTSMNTDMLSSQGTAIEAALELANTYYNDEDQTNRVLFILSDGEDHSGKVPVERIELARENNIRIFTIGIGKTKGSPIPIKSRGVTESYKKDSEGEVVLSKLNEEVLIELAQLGGGRYLPGIDTEEVVEQIQEELAQMDKKEFEAKEFAEYQDQFQWFLGAGFLFLFLDVLVLDRKTEWLRKLNLFNDSRHA